jgi:hypothetical protein
MNTTTLLCPCRTQSDPAVAEHRGPFVRSPRSQHSRRSDPATGPPIHGTQSYGSNLGGVRGLLAGNVKSCTTSWRLWGAAVGTSVETKRQQQRHLLAGCVP